MSKFLHDADNETDAKEDEATAADDAKALAIPWFFC